MSIPRLSMLAPGLFLLACSSASEGPTPCRLDADCLHGYSCVGGTCESNGGAGGTSGHTSGKGGDSSGTGGTGAGGSTAAAGAGATAGFGNGGFGAGGAKSSAAGLGFSAQSNPSGPWSYGWSQGEGAPFQSYQYAVSFAGLPFWQRTPATNTPPLLGYNGTGSTVSYSTATVPAGVIVMHPGPSGEYSVLRWTCSQPGTYQVQGTFGPLDKTTTDVGILRSGSLIYQGLVSPSSSAQSGPLQLFLQTGETIDFVVGSDGAYEGDSTGVLADVVQVGGG